MSVDTVTIHDFYYTVHPWSLNTGQRSTSFSIPIAQRLGILLEVSDTGRDQPLRGHYP